MTHRIDYAKVSPDGYKAFGAVYVSLLKCGLPQELVNLVYLRVSQINGCAYCIDMHSRDLLKQGLAIDKLVLVPVWHDAGAIFSRANAPRWPGPKSLPASLKPVSPMPTTRPLRSSSARRNWPT